MNRHDFDLDQIRIASPCNASWEGMTGDNRRRFCGECRKHVYNLSSMSESEAKRLLLEGRGELCVQFRRRRDGKVLVGDCPVGWRAGTRRRLARLAGNVIAALFALPALVGCLPKGDRAGSGGGEAPPPASGCDIEPLMGEVEIMGEVEMGDVLVPEFTETRGRVQIAPPAERRDAEEG